MSRQYPLILAMVFLTTIFSCDSVEKDMREANEEGGFNQQFNVDGAATESEIDRLRREMRAQDEYLAGLVGDEAAARILADEALANSILALSADFEAFRTDIGAKLTTVNERLDGHDTKLAAQESALLVSNAALTEAISAENQARLAQSDEIFTDIAALVAADDALVQRVSNNETAISDVTADLADLQEEFDRKIAEAVAAREKLAQDIVSLGVEVHGELSKQKTTLFKRMDGIEDQLLAVNRATTEQVNALRTELQGTIASATSALNDELQKDIADRDIALIAKLDAQKLDLETQLNGVETKLDNKIDLSVAELSASITSLRDKFISDLEAAEARLEQAISDGDSALQDTLTSEIETLTADISDLTTEIATVAASSDANHEQLTQELIAVRKDITDNAKATTDALAALEGRLTQDINTLRTAMAANDATAKQLIKDLDAKLLLSIGLVQADVDKIKDEDLPVIRANLASAVTTLGTKISDVEAASKLEDKNLAEKILQAEQRANATAAEKLLQATMLLDAKVAGVQSNLDSFIQHVNLNYATKSDLQLMAGVIAVGVTMALNTIQHQIDTNDAAVWAEIRRVDEKFEKKFNDLSADIASVKAFAEDIDTRFIQFIKDYTLEIATMKTNAKTAIADALLKIATVDANQKADKAELDTALQDMQARITSIETFAQEARKKLEDKVTELEGKVKDDQAAIAALKTAKGELLKAIEAEQTARAEVEAEVAQLIETTKAMQTQLELTTKLAEANENAISTIQNTLKEHGDQLELLDDKFTKMIEEVGNKAAEAVDRLDKKNIDEFKKLAIEIARLGNQSTAERDAVGEALKNLSGFDSFPVEKFNNEAKPLIDKAVIAANELRNTAGLIQSEFLSEDFLDAELGRFDITNILNSFKNDVYSKDECGGNINVDAPVLPMVAGNTAHFHLIRDGYLRLLFAGPHTSAVEINRIFLGLEPQVSGTDLASAVFLKMFPSFSSPLSPACISATQSWAKSLWLKTDNPKGLQGEMNKLRDKIVASDRFKKIITQVVKNVYKQLDDEGTALENLAIKYLKELTGDAKEAEDLVYKGNDKFDSARAVIANMIDKVSKNVESNSVKLQDMTTIAELAKTIAAVEGRVGEVEKKVADLFKKLENIEGKVDTLTKAMSEAYGLIYGMASRLGFTDIASAAQSILTELGLPKWKNRSDIPMSCLSSARVYPYKNNLGRTSECTSARNWGEGGTFAEDPLACRVRTQRNLTYQKTLYRILYYHYNHVIYYRWGYRYYRSRPWYTWYYNRFHRYSYAYYWSNRLIGNSTSIIAAQLMGNLKIPLYGFTDPRAMELVNRPVNGVWDSFEYTKPASIALNNDDDNQVGGDTPWYKANTSPKDKTMIGLEVFGFADKWKFTDSNTGKSVVVDAKDYAVSDVLIGSKKGKGWRYRIPAAAFLAKSSGQMTDSSNGVTQEVKIEAIDSQGNAFGQSCISRNAPKQTVVRYAGTRYLYSSRIIYTTYYRPSPIALDLDGDGTVTTVDPFDSETLFDIDADGKIDKIGWVDKRDGLLSLDANQNGKIDDGSELFGNYSAERNKTSAGKWKHGYAALAQYDDNKDGLITKSDKVFAKLRVWVDANQDGTSDQGELKTLASLKITGISTDYSDVFGPERRQASRSDSPGNELAYKSVYYGPAKCGKSGCVTYDINFGRDNHLLSSFASKE